MKLTLIALVAAFGLMGFMGSCEKGSSPKSDDQAYCQTHYKDADSCKADTACWWNPKKSKCVEAAEGVHK